MSHFKPGGCSCNEWAQYPWNKKTFKTEEWNYKANSLVLCNTTHEMSVKIRFNQGNKESLTLRYHPGTYLSVVDLCVSYSSVKRDMCLLSHIACPFVVTLRLSGTSTHQRSRMSFGSLPLWSHVRDQICGRCTSRLYPGHITVLQNGTEPLAHPSPSFFTAPSCPLEAQFWRSSKPLKKTWPTVAGGWQGWTRGQVPFRAEGGVSESDHCVPTPLLRLPALE